MSKDFDYIKGRFDGDNIKAPDSLSEDRIMEMLNAADEKAESKAEEFVPVTAAPAAGRSRVNWKKLTAVAACALIALIGSVPVYKAVTAPPDTGLVNGELYTFNSYSEIERLVKSVNGNQEPRLFNLGRQDVEYEVSEDADMASEGSAIPNETPLSDGAVSSSAGKSMAGTTGAAAEHSDTYLQVEEVDEADIVKTDGKYIYYVNANEEVVILKANKGKTKKVAVVGNTDVENYIHEIYLKGDRMITVGVVYEEDESSSAIVVYDISDRSKPRVISDFHQSGSIVSSRMVGNCVYLLTSDYVFNGGRMIPKCTIDGKYTNIPVSDICCVPQPAQSTYAIISSFDTSTGEKGDVKTKAIFGAADEIYCNNEHLYVAATEWNQKYEAPYTRIVKASIDGTDIKLKATTTVRGYIDDQFSMDEKDGYFRIATTSQRDGMDVNNLFVLDSSLKETGKVTGFARNESIRSVRYFGDKAYVITYKEIDPLFVIDLSDPASPRIEGEVKIDGFSTLLVPVGEGRLLGIGHATGDNGYGGEYDSGLKLALFDISDPSEPKVLDSKEFEDMNSPAQDTHKALTVNTKEGWYAIPYEKWNYIADDADDIIDFEEEEETTPDEDVISEDIEDIDLEGPGTGIEEDEYNCGVLVFGADDKLNIMDQHDLSSSYLYRSVYIGDYIYALDGDGQTYSFKFKK
ncbi:MAG: hypothetical protein E7220_04620 [Clostridiales bacterium]|nr:hypothetical protein [Clostridiales bacterium]